MVIHSVSVGGSSGPIDGGRGGCNTGITNGEKEGTGYFVTGSRVCMAPKCDKWKTKGKVQRTKFTCLIILLTWALPLPKKFIVLIIPCRVISN